MTDKPYIVRYRLLSVAPAGNAGIRWKEIVNRKDIHDNPSKHELISEFDTKAEANLFVLYTLADIVTGWLLYKLQASS